MNYMQMWYKLKKNLLEDASKDFSFVRSTLNEIVDRMDKLEIQSMEEAECERKQLLASVVDAN